MLDSWLPNPNVQKCLTYINMFWYGYQLPQLKQNPCCWKITWHIGPNNKITRDMPGTCLAPNPLGPSCWQELLRGFYLDSAAMPMVKFIELAEPERQSEVDEEWFDSGFVCVCVFVSFFVCFCKHSDYFTFWLADTCWNKWCKKLCSQGVQKDVGSVAAWAIEACALGVKPEKSVMQW